MSTPQNFLWQGIATAASANETMKSALRKLFAVLFKTRRRQLLCLLALLAAMPFAAGGLVLVFWTLPIFRGHLTTVRNPSAGQGLVYFHDTEPSVPWSMHVVKFSRARKDLELHSLMGFGTRQGMATVSQQLRQIPPAWGRPVAAVNGDLYNNDHNYIGDPEGLQVVHGELVSAPSPTRACFWVDTAGNPHHDDVRSQFQVTWPDGQATPFGLNEARDDASAVLFTAAVGASTRTYGGLELVLQRSGTNAWLPLQIGQTLAAQVRAVKSGGNTPIAPDTLVLSLGPELAQQRPACNPGTVLRLSTKTTPALTGISTAIGGGPTLVVGGKAKEWSGVRMRHPRTAIGWNRDYIYLVVVDGRQFRVSAGMTFPELADYLIRLGCEEAFGLDGGGSATCWANGEVRNSPSQGRERPAANSLVVLETGRGTN